MPCRSRDSQGKFLPKNPTPSSSEPSLFYNDYELPSLNVGELEDPLGEQAYIF